MKKFGRLLTDEIAIKKSRYIYYNCICDCGNEKIVERNSLFSGETKSCGCYQKEVRSKRATRHSMWGTKTYWAWAQARQRCFNIKDRNYHNYGGRGITMCDRWKKSFVSFFEDMGEAPIGSSLDRLENNDSYHKENCHWTTSGFQSYNRRKETKNTSGKTGVCLRKRDNKYRAYITVNKKQISLGLFNNIDDAIQVRKKAELQFYGKNKE